MFGATSRGDKLIIAKSGLDFKRTLIAPKKRIQFLHLESQIKPRYNKAQPNYHHEGIAYELLLYDVPLTWLQHHKLH